MAAPWCQARPSLHTQAPQRQPRGTRGCTKGQLTRSHRSRRPSRGQGGQALTGCPGPRDMRPRPDLSGASEDAVQGDRGLSGRRGHGLLEAAPCQARHGHPRLALGKVPWGRAEARTARGSGEQPAPRLSPGTSPQVDRWPSHTAMGQGHVRAFTRPGPPPVTGWASMLCPSPRPPPSVPHHPGPLAAAWPHGFSQPQETGGKNVPERNSSRGDCANAVENEIKTGNGGRRDSGAGRLLWGGRSLVRQRPAAPLLRAARSPRPRAGRALGAGLEA